MILAQKIILYSEHFFFKLLFCGLQDETLHVNGYGIFLDLAGYKAENFSHLKRREAKLRAQLQSVRLLHKQHQRFNPVNWPI